MHKMETVAWGMYRKRHAKEFFFTEKTLKIIKWLSLYCGSKCDNFQS